VANILGRCSEDGILGDVGRVITDAFDIASNEHEIEVIADTRGIRRHACGESVDDAMMQSIELAVALFEGAGQHFIAIGEATDAIAENSGALVEHFAQTGCFGQSGRFVETAGAARDAHSLVGDTLEVAAHLHGRDNFAEVVGQRLETHQDGDPGFVDGFFQGVDFRIIGNDPFAGLEIAGKQALGRRGDEALGERGHHQDTVAQGAQCVVEVAQSMPCGGQIHDGMQLIGRPPGRQAMVSLSVAGPGCDKNATNFLFASFAPGKGRKSTPSERAMKKVFLTPVLFLAALAGAAQAQQLSGAGATFPAPIYQRWAVEYNKQVPSIKVNYQSVGSGAGVKNFLQGVVDFGASDAAMTDEEMAKSPRGAVLVPATAGSVVLAYNLEGVPNLKLTRAALAGIFLGKITKWNDPAIVSANPDIPLPAQAINVAYRSDGSGTTFVFTQHLAAISPEFDEEVGFDKSVTFPVGVGGKGNEGVTALVKQTPGTIGYVEFGYAEQNKLPVASVENKSGNFVAPTPESGAAALASVELPENLRIWPVDPETPEAYPITTFSWLLLYKKYDDAAKLQALKDFVTYGLTEGQSFAIELGYIPLPESVVAKANAALSSIE
jgi:phosphate transport system substrate-binding protein